MKIPVPCLAQRKNKVKTASCLASWKASTIASLLENRPEMAAKIYKGEEKLSDMVVQEVTKKAHQFITKKCRNAQLNTAAGFKHSNHCSEIRKNKNQVYR